MYPKELLKDLIRNGWRIKRQKGSDVIIEKERQIEVIPMHNKELKVRNSKWYTKKNKIKIGGFLCKDFIIIPQSLQKKKWVIQ